MMKRKNNNSIFSFFFLKMKTTNIFFDYWIISVYFSGKDQSSSDFSSSEEESGSISDTIEESRDVSSTNSSWRTYFLPCILLWTCGVSSNSSSESSLGTVSIFGFNSCRESNGLCMNKKLDLFSLNQQNIINTR